MDKRGGLAKPPRSPLNMISRDDFLHDNDSSNDCAAVTKGLESLIKEQSQNTLGIFLPLVSLSPHSDLLIIKESKEETATSEWNLIVALHDVNTIPFQIRPH